MENKRVSAIIPAYNEEEKITETVGSILSIPLIDELVVVNDGSKDNTAYLALKAGAKVIDLDKNMGKGAALNRGVGEVTGDIIVLLDGDLGRTAYEAQRLITPIIQGKAEMTIAKFPPLRKKGGFGLVKGLARLGIKYLAGLDLEAPLSGQRAMTREVLEYIKSFQSGYGVEVGLTISVARGGFRILEVETQMSHNVTGRDFQGFWHRGRQFKHIVQVLWRVWREQG